MDWIVNDCGDYLEIIHRTCGTKSDFPHVEKRAFLDSTFNPSDDGYFLAGALVLSVKEFPNSVKDVLDRIHISGNLDRIATELIKKRARAESSNGRRILYLILGIVCLLLLVYSFPYGAIYTLGALVPLVLVLALTGRFQRKYAPWRIARNERLFIRLWQVVKNLQSYVKSGGVDEASFLDAHRLLDISGYAISVTSSWSLVNEAQWQMLRILSNIMRGIRPYVKTEKRNTRQIEQLVIPTLIQLLPLLINSDDYSIDAWNNMAEAKWPRPAAAAFSLSKLKGVLALRWVRITAASIAAIVAFAAGSPIEGVALVPYVKQNYQFFWVILIGFLGLVLAPDLMQRGDKSTRG